MKNIRFNNLSRKLNPEELLNFSLIRSPLMTVEQITSTITDLTPRPPVIPNPT